MANRYQALVGDWHGPIWAATQGGTAGSAPVPTADDDVYLRYGGVSIVFTSDAECKSLSGMSGVTRGSSFALNGHKLRVYGNALIGNLDTEMVGGGTIEVDGDLHSDGYNVSGSYHLIQNVSATSTLDIADGFGMAGSNIDMSINMGTSTSSATLNITGSPTFRSLIIQSKNSAAHTVNFEDFAFIYVTKLILIGSSTSNKLNLTVSGDFAPMATVRLKENYSTYGQYVDIDNITAEHDFGGGGFATKAYVGSNSTASQGGWLTQDPPKISTLVDPLTTAPTSNTNWSVLQDGSGVIQVTDGHGGGGYNIRGPVVER